MSLNDVAVKNAKATGKVVRIFDGRGLYLEVSPTGDKWWRFKYRFNGKEKRLSLGTYPEISLKDAREKRDELRRILANQIDPAEHRKMLKSFSVERSLHNFESSACEWLSKYSPSWSQSHAKRMVRLFERDLFPLLGNRPIADITPPQLLDAGQRLVLAPNVNRQL